MSDITDADLQTFYDMLDCFQKHYITRHTMEGDRISHAINYLASHLPGEVCELPREEE